MRARIISVSILLASICPGIPAQSADILGMFQDASSKYIAGWDDLDSRASAIDASIADGVKTGNLTATQVADFRAELKRILDVEAQLKASGKRMTFAQSLSFGNELASLSAGVEQAKQHTVSSMPDITKLAAQIETTIGDGMKSGQLDQALSDKFKADLRSIRDIEAAYKEASGTLTPRQVEILSAKLSKLQSEVTQQLQLGQTALPALTRRRVAIDSKLQQGIAAGKLTAQEVADFHSKLEKVNEEQTTILSTSAGVITGPQVVKLAKDLDAIDDSIEVKLGLNVQTGGAQGPGGGWPGQSGAQGPGGGWQGQGGAQGPGGGWQGQGGAQGPGGGWQGQGGVQGPGGGWQGQGGAQGPGGGWQGQGGAQGPGGGWQGQGGAQGPGGGWQGRGDAQGPGGGGQGRHHGGRWGRRGGDASGPGDDLHQSVTAAGVQPEATPASTSRFSIGELPVLSSKNFNDVGGFWAQGYIEDLASRGVIGGFPNGTFKPSDQITRAQFAAIVASALKLAPTTGQANFNDVPVKHWASGVIGAASNNGLITGYPDGTFRPEDKITRAQALVILSKALSQGDSSDAKLKEYADAAGVPSWATASVAQAANAHIIVSFPDSKQIRPNELATRGDVAALMYQTLSALGANLPPLRIGVMGN